jgi:hypothetical protein
MLHRTTADGQRVAPPRRALDPPLLAFGGAALARDQTRAPLRFAQLGHLHATRFPLSRHSHSSYSLSAFLPHPTDTVHPFVG